MVKKLFLALMLIAAPASAQFSSQFTSQEQAELARLHTARVEVSAQLRNLSDAITHSQVEATRPQFYQAALSGIESLYDCHQAIRHLLNSAPEFDQFAAEPPFAGLPRAEVVARAFPFVASCDTKIADFASRLVSTGQAALANPKPNSPLSNNQANIIIAGGARLQNPQVISLSVFNTSLPYTSWQPVNYPNIIGPHGDYNTAQLNVNHADLKWLETLKDVTTYYGQAASWNQKANVGYREMLAYGSDALGLLTRVWYINAGMVLRFPDQQAIDADFAFSTGLRPKSFFAILRSFELINSPDPHLTGLGGRALAAGITGQFAVVLDQLGEMVAGFDETNSLAAIQAQNNMGGGQTSFVNAGASSGRAREAHVDLAQAWLKLDSIGLGQFLFFRPPQPPPVGGCPAGETCQPPPPTCPVFDPQIVLLDGTTAEARCVQRP